MNTKQRLKKAAEAGEVITVIYHGGSQSGAKRNISPIRVTPTEMRARCLSTDEVKTYFVDKIEIVPENYPAPEYVPGAENPPDFETLAEALSDKIKELKALGWHVELSEESITLHEYFKNGKPKKGAVIGVQKNKFSGYDFATTEDEIAYLEDPQSLDAIKALKTARQIPSMRPWYVFGPDMATARTFSHLDKAVELFMNQVRAHAPKGEKTWKSCKKSRRRRV